MSGDGPAPMELVGVRVELPTNTPVVVLRELTGQRRFLSIFIGAPEATAIAFALEQVPTPRPLTHDLMRDIFTEVGVNVVGMCVTELRSQTYFAELQLEAFGSRYTVSSRPSDAIALAVRVGCPILASRQLLDEVGYVEESSVSTGGNTDPDPDVVVEEFRHFIDSVNPDDFAS